MVVLNVIMRLVLPLIFLVLIFSCKNDKKGEEQSYEKKVERGFYYWKQNFDLSNEQVDFLKKTRTDVLYLKYFDVIWNGWDYEPSAVMNWSWEEDARIPIVPTIYITTEVFSRMDSVAAPRLAEKIVERISWMNYNYREFDEIQIDCDWTPSIKDKYFRFLEELKHHYPEVTVSATIRLYQYKYPDIAGVPPVDKGLLMYYNMGDLTKYEENNSILDNGLGKQYLGFNEYPLPLDIALPNFKWGLLYRQGKFEQICPDFTESQLNNNDLFSFRKPNWYIFKKDTVIDNTYFRFGDELRFESCNEDELLAAVELLKEEMNQEETRVLFYDLQPYTHEEFEKIDAVFSAFDE